MKVIIAIPCLSVVPSEFMASLARLTIAKAYDKKFSREVKLGLEFCQGSLVHTARNLLTSQALAVGATHIFFLDSDVICPADTLDRLIAHHEPIVLASYMTRFKDNKGQHLIGEPLHETSPNGRLAAMRTAPLGCALIDLKVFQRLPKPWFAYLEGETPDNTISEDTYFCNAARQAGYTIWLDHMLTREVGHVTSSVILPRGL